MVLPVPGNFLFSQPAETKNSRAFRKIREENNTGERSEALNSPEEKIKQWE